MRETGNDGDVIWSMSFIYGHGLCFQRAAANRRMKTEQHHTQNSTYKPLTYENLQTQHINITQSNNAHIYNLNTRNDIILTKTDKNMGWALIPTSWFNNEYTRHFTDTTTYRRIYNFDLTATITNSNKLLRKLQLRFNKLLSTPGNKQLLDTITKDKIQLPYMKLLPKVHKLTDTASPSNLNRLTVDDQ